MINRRNASRLALATLLMSTAGLPPLAAYGQQSFQRFFPLLVDLPGWKGGKPDGASVEIPGNSMVTATREYQRDQAQINAQVLVGAPAQGALAATGGAVKVETSDARMSTSTIDGLQVTRTFAIPDKSGAVFIALGPNAVFLVSFNGINDDEALTLARRFNWKAIQAAVPK